MTSDTPKPMLTRREVEDWIVNGRGEAIRNTIEAMADLLERALVCIDSIDCPKESADIKAFLETFNATGGGK